MSERPDLYDPQTGKYIGQSTTLAAAPMPERGPGKARRVFGRIARGLRTKGGGAAKQVGSRGFDYVRAYNERYQKDRAEEQVILRKAKLEGKKRGVLQSAYRQAANPRSARLERFVLRQLGAKTKAKPKKRRSKVRYVLVFPSHSYDRRYSRIAR